MKIFAILGGAALLAVASLLKPGWVDQPETWENQPEAEQEACESEGTTAVRATLRKVKHDMNPVTLQGWTRIICDCEDGVERTMSFDGDTGVYLMAGESGLLEHRDGVFVSFTKDSGEMVTKLYRMLPEAADSDASEDTEE
ncbi:MAG: hypothetical protein IJE07_14540 [Clostridia bacterium]|nr:hypothetical protein [Clostridia bacterium]